MSKTTHADKKYFDYLSRVCRNSAGPRPCISGMRKQFWGKDAYIVMCNGYAFWVNSDIFFRFAFK